MDAHKPDQPTVADDPQAREVLRRAFENTARWPKDFKGFTADLSVNLNGRELHGPVIVKGPREVSVQLADGDLQKWAQDQLAMIAGIEANGIRPVISDRFPLADLAAAFRHQESGRHFGKIAVEI